MKPAGKQSQEPQRRSEIASEELLVLLSCTCCFFKRRNPFNPLHPIPPQAQAPQHVT